MELTTIWFCLIAVLWIGYFVLEGFDFGVGALLRLVGKDEKGRRVLINNHPMTIIGVVIFSGRFFTWPRLEQFVAVLVLVGLGWLLVRTGE